MWSTTFGGTGTEGSGFFQRLNIVSSEETRTVPILAKPDFSQFSGLVDKVKDLGKKPYQLGLTPEARSLFTRWLRYWIKIQPDGSDITGRLQVMVQRNAMHLGWLLNTPATLSAVNSTEIIRRAIAIANHQLRTRRKHKPVMGDNPWAVMENLISRCVKKAGKITRSELFKKVHGERYGLKTFNQALELLERDEVIHIENLPGRGRKAQVICWRGN